MSKKNYELEISKMLTLGTCHITEETCNWLSYTERIPLCVYPKDYGFFILTDSSCFGIEAFQELPEDLATILQFAVEKNCSWICLDSDGKEVSELPAYEW